MLPSSQVFLLLSSVQDLNQRPTLTNHYLALSFNLVASKAKNTVAVVVCKYFPAITSLAGKFTPDLPIIMHTRT